ncbi:MAG: restriction endonuclease subunit S [Dehalococcoidia bacterium]
MKWPEVQFAEVAEIVTGNTPPKKDPDNYGPGVPWAKPPDLDAWEPVTKTAETLSPKGQKLARLLPERTVMVCCIGSIGRVGIAGTTLATNQQINSLIFGPRVEPMFGYYYCRLIPQQFQATARNAVVPILNKSNFSKITMPLPTLSEQRRIVEILDQADALRKKRAEADAKAARILPALFYKMFGDPNQPHHPTRNLQEVVECLDHRRIPVREADRVGRRGDVPYYGANGLVDFIDEQIFDETLVLLAEDGGYWGPSDRSAYKIEGPSWVNNHAHVLRCKDGTDPDFLVCCLNLLDLRKYISGTTRGKLTQAAMNGIQLPFPDPDRQSAFGIKARQLASLDISIKRSRDKLELLFSSFLHRAFTGDLTAKWREAHMKELLAEMQEQAKALNERAEQ